MNKQALFHKVRSNFSFAINNSDVCLRLRTAKNDDIKKVNVIWNTCHYFYHAQNKTEMVKKYSDDLFDYYEAIIGNNRPGYFYFFEIIDNNDKIINFFEDGIHKEFIMEDIFHDAFNYTFINENDLVKQNKRLDGRLFYQIFPERFASYSKKKNKSYINLDWNSKKVDNEHFMGGDLKGIIEKLDYIKSLGVGAIYLTPIHPSISAHKYDVDDYYDIDLMFGSRRDLKDLINKAHELDIIIVMDLVFNHCSFYNDIFQDVCRNGKDSKYYDWFFIDGDYPNYDKLNYESFADVKMMPKLNTNNPEVAKYLIGIGKHYIKEFNVDGYRLDVAQDISKDFWIKFKRAMKEIDNDIFLIGEHWLDASYYLSNECWDSVMNYSILYLCERYYKKDEYNTKEFVEQIHKNLLRYGTNTNLNLLNLLDSHDTERFYNSIKPNKDLYLLAVATLIFYTGCPMIYYGDEIFMDGGKDPQNRKGMEWDSKEFKGKYHQIFKDILSFRKYKALRNGSIKVYEENNLLFINRAFENESFTLVINHSFNNKLVDLNNVIYSFNYENNIMKHNSFLIFKN